MGRFAPGGCGQVWTDVRKVSLGKCEHHGGCGQVCTK